MIKIYVENQAKFVDAILPYERRKAMAVNEIRKEYVDHIFRVIAIALEEGNPNADITLYFGDELPQYGEHLVYQLALKYGNRLHIEAAEPWLSKKLRNKAAQALLMKDETVRMQTLQRSDLP